ncbi:hypothetical protein ASE63_26020 [Bosea sp. Root381]|uniref:hypothetical protein n=1 Tax=Bosea sp. Root381 TaxID=1736524 RepID=UPI0006F5B9CA|nr:hypothetical protein [Bosea sp. Root381]KRE03569.1 hypothetical protein ASE63_26020 [Bosea sp. Root381]
MPRTSLAHRVRHRVDPGKFVGDARQRFFIDLHLIVGDRLVRLLAESRVDELLASRDAIAVTKRISMPRLGILHFG